MPIRLQSLLKRVADRRLIFCINSGRAGSNYLAELLGTAADVQSFHEADPPITDAYLEMITRAPYPDSFKERKIKVRSITRQLRRMKSRRIYAETNHMFIKTFYDVVLDAFKNVEVIILRRDLAAVLKSFIELNYFTDKNPNSPKWMSSPNAVTAALRPLGADEDLDQFDRSIAYLLDIEARAQRFRREYPAVAAHEVRLESLNDIGNVEKLFAALRISPTDQTRSLLGQPVNPKTQLKDKFQNPTTLEICRDRIRDYLDRARRDGIEVPATLAFESVSGAPQ